MPKRASWNHWRAARFSDAGLYPVCARAGARHTIAAPMTARSFFIGREHTPYGVLGVGCWVLRAWRWVLGASCLEMGAGCQCRWCLVLRAWRWVLGASAVGAWLLRAWTWVLGPILRV